MASSFSNDLANPDLANPPTVRSRLRPVMGTLCAIEACGPAHALNVAVEQAFAAMSHVEHCMHPVHPGSDLARLNSSVRQPLRVDQALWEVLATARRIHDLSNGIFDPCLPVRAGRLRDVELLPESTVLCHAPVTLDLGGIAKGYAIDLATDVLRDAGCVAGLINAGGDLRVFGGQSREIVIRWRDRPASTLSITCAALAVSDAAAIDRPPEHRGYYARDNDRALIHSQVAVQADTAVVADALTKCLMLGTEIESVTLLSALNARRVLPA